MGIRILHLDGDAGFVRGQRQGNITAVFGNPGQQSPFPVGPHEAPDGQTGCVIAPGQNPSIADGESPRRGDTRRGGNSLHQLDGSR